MKISINEFVELNNKITDVAKSQYEKGTKDEAEKQMPNNLFDALLDYARKSKTLIDWHKSSNASDGCNWVQIKPTRDGAQKVAHVEISFENNLMAVSHIGAALK